jgi:hypothetical protein
MQDDEIIPLLLQMRRPTFFTRDRHFYDEAKRSGRYCLAYLNVGPLVVAEYIGRFLRHPCFRTWAQRQNCVVRLQATGITARQAHPQRTMRFLW